MLTPLVLCGAPAYASDARTLTVDEGRELARAAMPPLTARLPGVYLDVFKNPYYPDFYFFEITWNSTGDMSPIADHYAVDSRTGDVWKAVICRELKSPALSMRQAVLRKKIGLTPKQYRKIRRRGPGMRMTKVAHTTVLLMVRFIYGASYSIF
jgi:hypothetical protein